MPFGLLGIALGYWATPRGALPLANVLYLGLAYAGGALDHRRRGSRNQWRRSRATCRRGSLANVLGAVASGAGWSLRDWTALGVFSGLFALAAAAGYRRDEIQRFH